MSKPSRMLKRVAERTVGIFVLIGLGMWFVQTYPLWAAVLFILFIGFCVYGITRLFGNGELAVKRARRAPFKQRYGLTQRQPIDAFEAKMFQGMCAENREIFVTAFCNNSEVLRVTATMGSKRSCRNSDDISLWAYHADRVGATRIRQYHNHPNELGRSFTSSADRQSHRSAVDCMEGTGIRFESLLVYQSWLGGCVIKPYSGHVFS